MGAAAILRAVACCGANPDGIISEAVFDSMLSTVKNRFRLMRVPSFPSAQLLVFWGGTQNGFNAFTHDPARYAQSVKCPILFLHGTDDPRARLEEGRRVFQAVPGRKWFEEFPGLAHADALMRFPDQWKTAVTRFIQEIAPP
jgi:pimeloyl-ACP methyl ester carboxylesterase